MVSIDNFKAFKIKLPENIRLWEDDSTGVILRRNKPPVTIGLKEFRSSELKFALLRSRVLLVDTPCEFVFKGQLVKVEPGRTKNLVTVLKDFCGKIPDNTKVIDEEPVEVITKTLPPEAKTEIVVDMEAQNVSEQEELKAENLPVMDEIRENEMKNKPRRKTK